MKYAPERLESGLNHHLSGKHRKCQYFSASQLPLVDPDQTVICMLVFPVCDCSVTCYTVAQFVVVLIASWSRAWTGKLQQKYLYLQVKLCSSLRRGLRWTWLSCDGMNIAHSSVNRFVLWAGLAKRREEEREVDGESCGGHVAFMERPTEYSERNIEIRLDTSDKATTIASKSEINR